jgi:hypothetical protein
MYNLPATRWEMENAMSLMIPCPICRAAPNHPCVYNHPDALRPGQPRSSHTSRLQPAREALTTWESKQGARHA